MAERLAKGAITALDALHHGEDSGKGQKMSERGTVPKITKTDHPPHPASFKSDPQGLTMAERLANGAITALDGLHHGEDSDKGQKLSERGTVPKITKIGSPTTPGVLQIRLADDGREACQRCDHRS